MAEGMAPNRSMQRRAAVFVACSTLCFARYPLDQALRAIAELGFGKAAIAIHDRGLPLDPSHFIAGQKEARDFDSLYPYVRHVRFRDTGRGPNQFQVRVGQGEVEYGRIVSQLARHRYDRLLTVDIRDVPDAPFAME